VEGQVPGMTALLILAGLVLSPNASARGLELIYKNNAGVAQFKKEKFLDSYESFMALTAVAPYDPHLQFNLGGALAANS
jgi:hypothetical protein